MFLGLKILGACALGISCVVSASWLANNKTVGADDDSPSIWKVADKSSFPILTCKNEKASIVVSLKPQNGLLTLNEKEKINFSGYEEKSKESVDLLQKEVRKNGTNFQLIIFKDTGNHWIGEIGGEDSHKYGDDLICEKGVFVKLDNERWEGGFDKIQLTLENCQGKNGKKECEIKIGDEVGLRWKDDFNPKVIF